MPLPEPLWSELLPDVPDMLEPLADWPLPIGSTRPRTCTRLPTSFFSSLLLPTSSNDVFASPPIEVPLCPDVPVCSEPDIEPLDELELLLDEPDWLPMPDDACDDDSWPDWLAFIST
jgi:hypothetical protein